jgi:hypothetical protein
VALTQLPAVEPSCGGFCGELPRSALFSTVFLKYLLLTGLKTEIQLFRDFASNNTSTLSRNTDFSITNAFHKFYLYFQIIYMRV